jgi:hypothetical protein
MTKTHHKRYPRPIARFLHLAGGQYGTADLIAISDDILEFQLGGDFVRFSREQAEDLGDAVRKFLHLEEEEDERRVVKAVEEVVEAAEDLADDKLRERDSEPPSEPLPRRRKKARPST